MEKKQVNGIIMIIYTMILIGSQNQNISKVSHFTGQENRLMIKII